MTTARGWTPTLRYSPLNHIIVDWGINGQPFSMCGMPERNCEAPSPVPSEASCTDLPITEGVDTYDWYRWIPEIIVGLSNTSDDMAASYARRAAREFAAKGRVLKRQIAVRLQQGVFRYPMEAFDEEQIQGVMFIDSALGSCSCSGTPQTNLFRSSSGLSLDSARGVNIGAVQFNVSRQELVISPLQGCCGAHVGNGGPEYLLVTVWSAPTEDSCKHDAYLYEQYRREITVGARADFISEAHAIGVYKTTRGYANFRGDQMLMQQASVARKEFMSLIRKARVEAELEGFQEIGNSRPSGSLFGRGCGG